MWRMFSSIILSSPKNVKAKKSQIVFRFNSLLRKKQKHK